MHRCAASLESGSKMSSKYGTRALLRRGRKCPGVSRSFMTSTGRSNARGVGQGYTPNVGGSWSTRGVFAVAGVAGILGWGVAKTQKGDQNGNKRTEPERRYATVREMEKVSIARREV